MKEINWRATMPYLIAVIAFLAIIASAIASAYYIGSLMTPDILKKKGLLIMGVILFNVIIFLSIRIINSRTTILTFILLSSFIHACLALVGALALFGINIKGMELIFSGFSTILGVAGLIWNFVFLFSLYGRLTDYADV